MPQNNNCRRKYMNLKKEKSYYKGPEGSIGV